MADSWDDAWSAGDISTVNIAGDECSWGTSGEAIFLFYFILFFL